MSAAAGTFTLKKLECSERAVQACIRSFKNFIAKLKFSIFVVIEFANHGGISKESRLHGTT